MRGATHLDDCFGLGYVARLGAITLFLSVGSFLVMFWFNQEIGLIFIGMFAVAFVWFAMTGHLREAAADALLAPVPPLEGALARGDVDR